MTRSTAVPALVTGGEMAERRPPSPVWTWLGPAYDAFDSILTSGTRDYPCHFGVDGELRGLNRFAHVDRGADPDVALDLLAGVLLAYLELVEASEVKRRSLVVFDGPPAPGLDLPSYEARFWDLLSALHRRDPRPWPDAVPSDTADPAWQWCFGGERWFVFGGCPAYRNRASRVLGPCLVLVFQTHHVFQEIGGETAPGKAAKRTIRRRLRGYDRIGPNPALGDAQHSSVFKWRQYFLPDDDRLRPADACPFDPGPDAATVGGPRGPGRGERRR
jgi:uncharacterized protein